jgi:serine phosphatase RsbU (regulator of sigma subunit)
MPKFILFSILVLFIGNFSYNQEKGNYFLKNFDPKISGLNAQTWTGIEDINGVLYFASGNKISIYDGRNWTSLHLKNDAPPLSFCKDEKGKIYVGGVGEIGYLEADKQGVIKYISLKNKVPKKQQNFQNVWTSVYLNNHVYFSTDEGYFDYDGTKINFVNIPIFFTLNKVGDEIYFNNKKDGLYVINKKGLHKAKNNTYFIDAPIAGAVGLNNEEIIFLNGKEGITLYNKKTGEIDRKSSKFLQYKTFLRDAYVYSLEKTINNKIAVGTIYKGLQLFDIQGNLINEVTTNNGLINNAINKIVNDHLGNIWLCTDKGVSRLEINTGIKNWGLNEGIENTVEDVIKYKNKLFIASSTNVKYLENGKFLPISGLHAETWKFCEVGSKLFIANSKGLYQINELTKSAEPIYLCNLFYIEKKNDLEILLGCDNGVYLYNLKTKQPIKLTSTQSAVRSIGIDQNKYIWFATDNTGIGYIDGRHIYFIDQKHGLKNLGYNQIFTIKDNVFIGTKNALYQYDYQSKKLKKSCQIHPFLCNDELGIFRLKYDGKNHIYTSTYGDNTARVSKISLKNKHRDTTDLKKLPKFHIYSFFGDQNNIWLGTPDGLYKYEPAEHKQEKYKFRTLIRQVIIGKDSLLYGGNTQKHHKISKVNYDFNEVSFFFSSPYFLEEEKTLFQYKLEGFDEEWSEWSTDNYKNYTNLFEGKYTFKARAMNVYGEISEVGHFTFKIRPPWYRSILAYIIYTALFILIIYVTVRIYTKRLREANIKLEKIVAERTAEVVKQRDEIQEKNEMITESIEYAKTIQEAIITSNEYFNTLFTDLFILFKPKDIVSGDFYWAYKTKSNKIFWAAADCTGHGVPGAFMTMIGISLLNEIIIEKEIEETNLILDALRDSVIKTLNKNIDLDSDEKMRNGMDIALCCWDLNTNEISFSGANNPMYILRDNELIETKGDKQPIGIYKKMTPFSKNTIQLQTGDKIYTFSDGYADQMNEEENRFKIANLKKAILEVGNLKTSDQKVFFNDTYENWKGNYEQMDDVVLICVEI